MSPEGLTKGAEVRLAEAVGTRRLAHEDGREPPRVRGAQHARPEAVARRRVHRATRRAIQPRRLLGGDAQALGGSLVARVRVDEVPRERAERHTMRRRRVHLRHGANAVRACRRGPPPIVAGARAAPLSWFPRAVRWIFERTDNSVFFFFTMRDPHATREREWLYGKQSTSGKNRDYSPVTSKRTGRRVDFFSSHCQRRCFGGDVIGGDTSVSPRASLLSSPPRLGFAT